MESREKKIQFLCLVSFTQHDFCDVLLSQCLYQNSLLLLLSSVPWYGYATVCLPFLWLLALEFLAFGRGRLSCCDPLCASLFLNIDCFFLERYWEWNCQKTCSPKQNASGFVHLHQHLVFLSLKNFAISNKRCEGYLIVFQLAFPWRVMMLNIF